MVNSKEIFRSRLATRFQLQEFICRIPTSSYSLSSVCWIHFSPTSASAPSDTEAALKSLCMNAIQWKQIFQDEISQTQHCDWTWILLFHPPVQKMKRYRNGRRFDDAYIQTRHQNLNLDRNLSFLFHSGPFPSIFQGSIFSEIPSLGLDFVLKHLTLSKTYFQDTNMHSHWYIPVLSCSIKSFTTTPLAPSYLLPSPPFPHLPCPPPLSTPPLLFELQILTFGLHIKRCL